MHWWKRDSITAVTVKQLLPHGDSAVRQILLADVEGQPLSCEWGIFFD